MSKIMRKFYTKTPQKASKKAVLSDYYQNKVIFSFITICINDENKTHM